MRAATDEAIAHPRRETRPGLPFAFILGCVSGLAIALASAAPFRDIDLYWHLRAGLELASGTSPRALGTGWSIAPTSISWVSTQWLSELAAYRTQLIGGWAWIAAYRVLTCAIAIGVLAWTTLRNRPRALAAFPYLVAVLALVLASQERPQQITYVGAAALGGVLASGLVRGYLPRWWILLPLTVLWANLHGGWVLVPATLALIALGGFVDRGLRDQQAWRAVGLGALALVAGAATPSGFSGIVSPLAFSRAAGGIQEWMPTEPMSRYGGLTVVILALLCVGWARSTRVPPSEVMASLAVLAFTWLAWRNVAPGLVLLAPIAAYRLTVAFPGVSSREPQWSVPAGVSAASFLAVVALAGLPSREHLPLESLPIGLASRIDQLPPAQRVLNDYSVAGAVLWFGPRDARVSIDGRADRYGAEYIDAYLDLMDLQGDWEALLAQLNPSSALIEEDSALAHVLQTERGWEIIDRENGFVLLKDPSGGGGR